MIRFPWPEYAETDLEGKSKLHDRNVERNVFCVDYRLSHTLLEKQEKFKKINITP